MNPFQFLENEEYEIEFAWINKNLVGLLEPEKNKIIINFQLLIVKTFLHEFIHDAHSEWNEKKVEEGADKMIDRMTVKEIQILADRLIEMGFERKINPCKKENEGDSLRVDSDKISDYAGTEVVMW